MTTAINKISPSNPMLTINQVALMLGCSRRSVGRYEMEGLVSYTRSDGTGKRFLPRDVERFIRVKYVKATVTTEDKKGAKENAGMRKKKMALTA